MSRGRSVVVQGSVQGSAAEAEDVVVFLPPAGSITSPYLPIGACLPHELAAAHCEVPGRGRTAHDDAPASVHDAVDRWAGELAGLFPGRRLHLFGHSLGALFAYELALRFEASSVLRIASLSVSGAREPGSAPRSLLTTAFQALRQQQPASQQDGGTAEFWLTRDLQMRREYRTEKRPVRAPLALFCGTSDPFARPAEMEEWKHFASGPLLGTHEFPGGHDYYLSGQDSIAATIGRIVQLSRHTKPMGEGITVDKQNVPSVEQLIDVIANSSVGIAVTDATGGVVFHNRAQSVLMGGEGDHLKGRFLVDGAREDGLQLLLQRLKKEGKFENVRVTYRSDAGKDEWHARVNAVRSGSGNDTRLHWVSRPELGERLPVSNDSTEDASSDAASWIRAVNERELPSLAPTADKADIMREFYELAPVAIHLIGVNGQVMHANPTDVALVEYSSAPSEYVGGHIRNIYEDQGLLDDFLSRWDEDSPIINFRANFVTKEGAPKPVLIFSTAQAEGGSVSNTRCFVFSDPEPQRARDAISAFGWPA